MFEDNDTHPLANYVRVKHHEIFENKRCAKWNILAVNMLYTSKCSSISPLENHNTEHGRDVIIFRGASEVERASKPDMDTVIG